MRGLRHGTAGGENRVFVAAPMCQFQGSRPNDGGRFELSEADMGGADLHQRLKPVTVLSRHLGQLHRACEGDIDRLADIVGEGIPGDVQPQFGHDKRLGQPSGMLDGEEHALAELVVEAQLHGERQAEAGQHNPAFGVAIRPEGPAHGGADVVDVALVGVGPGRHRRHVPGRFRLAQHIAEVVHVQFAHPLDLAGRRELVLRVDPRAVEHAEAGCTVPGALHQQ